MLLTNKMNTAIYFILVTGLLHSIIIIWSYRTISANSLLWPECLFGKLHIFNISTMRWSKERARERKKNHRFSLNNVKIVIATENNRGTNSSKSSHDEWIIALYSIMTCIKFWLHSFAFILIVVIIIIFVCFHSQFTAFQKKYYNIHI